MNMQDECILNLESKLQTSLQNLQKSEKRVLELEKHLEEKSRVATTPAQVNGTASVDGGNAQTGLHQEIEALSKTNNDLCAQLAAGKQKFKQDNKLLAKEIAKLRDSNEQLEAEVSELRGGLDEKMTEAKKASEEEKVQLQSRAQELEVALEQQSSKLQELKTAALSISQDKDVTANTTVAELDRLCNELRAENNELRNEKKVMDAKLQTAVDQMSAAEDALESTKKGLEAECVQFRAQYTSSEARADGLKLELQQLESNLALVSTERDSLKIETAHLQESQQKVSYLESQVESLTVDNSRLGDLTDKVASVQEQLSSATTTVEGLWEEVDQLKKEKACMMAEKDEALSQITTLMAEIDALRQSENVGSRTSEELLKLSADVETLNAEKAQLVLTMEKQERNMAAQTRDLLAQIKELSTESEELGAFKAEIEEVRKERDSWREKCEQDIREQGIRLAEQKAALQRTLGEVSDLKEALGHSEHRERVAAQEALELQSKIKELDAALMESETAANGTEDLSISHVAEVVRLQSEIETLREENAVLRHSDGKDDLLEEAGDQASGMTDIVKAIRTNLAQCTSSVPTLSGQTPLSPDVVTDLMEQVTQSNSMLQEIAAQADNLRSLPSTQTSEMPLSTVVAGLVTDLVTKCREVNEMRVDQLLTRAEVSSGSIPIPNNADPQSRQRGNTISIGSAKSLDSNQGRRGVFSRIGSPGGQSPEQSQMPEGDSKVKRFLGGMGSKMSSGSQVFMDFMQRGSLQTNLLETPGNNPSTPESSSGQGGQNLNSPQR